MCGFPDNFNLCISHAKLESCTRQRQPIQRLTDVADITMLRRLLVAGSNSGYQLGAGHDQDVRTFSQALCRITGQQETTPFPPDGYTLLEVSSGANHTLAILEPYRDEHDDAEASRGKEIWACGTGDQGQLGPAHVSVERKPLDVFTRLDLPQLVDGNISSGSSGDLYEPKQVICGWNSSYVVLSSRSESSGQDLLISLGSHRHNTFGELGVRADGTSSKAAASCLHMVSFANVLEEAGLDVEAPYRIIDVAAGLRHVVAALSVDARAERPARTIVAGWGSARQGQVGRVPDAASSRPGPSKRPGPAAVVVEEPQLIFDWPIEDPASNWCRLSAGRDHTVVLRPGSDAEGMLLQCIGSNKQGQLIDKSALPGQGAWHIADVACNWNSTHLLINKQGETAPVILNSGSNSRGQLGNSSSASSSAETPLTSADLSAIWQHHTSPSASAPAIFPPNDHNQFSALPAGEATVKKLVSGSEHSLLLIHRKSSTTHSLETQVLGWGWNEHGNLAQGEHDEADRDRPVLLLDGTRSGAAEPKYTPLDIWAGCGTTFILAETNINL